MRALKLVVFGDGQALVNALPRSAYRESGTGEVLALGAFEFPELEAPRGLAAWRRNRHRLREFEASTTEYCQRVLDAENPPVLLIAVDAVRVPADRRPFGSARTVASDCLSVAALRTGTDTTVVAVVVRSPEDLQELAKHVDRGHFDALRVGGLTVLDAHRLRRELPSEVQAGDLV